MQEINLYDLLKHYAKYWLFILLCSLIGLIAGLAYNNYVQVPMYKSNATLLVVNKDTSNSTEKTTVINNYIELIKSRRVLEPVIEKLKLDQSYEQLVDSANTSNDKDTEVIKLTIASTDPQKSKQIVDATVTSFKDEINRLYKTDTIQVIDNANLPKTAYNVRKTIQLVLFTVASFLFSIIVVFFIYDYNLNSRTKGKPKSDSNTKPSILARYHAKSSVIRKTLKAKKQVRKVKRELKNQAKAQARKLAEVQKATERKAQTRKKAAAKAVATKKAKAQMIVQTHKEEAERTVKLEQLKAKQIVDAKRLALAEVEAKKLAIIKQDIAAKKAQARQERRAMRIAKRELKNQAKRELKNQAKTQARKLAAVLKAELDKQVAIARVAAIGKAKRAEQAAKFSTNAAPALSQSTKAEKK